MNQSQQSGIYFVDSTPIPVCKFARHRQNKVFKGLAKKSKSLEGWYYGLKLHMVINEMGEIMNISLSQANVDDRKPVPQMVKKLSGLLFGDKGYISQSLFERLYDNGLKMVTKIKKNMQNKLVSLFEKIVLKKRNIIETVFGQIKEFSALVHSRHRSIANFTVSFLSSLIAYFLNPHKPSIKLPLTLS